MRTKTLWIRTEYLAQILDGHKTIEVRVAYHNVARLQAGDRLLLNDCPLYRIRRIEHYGSFEELLRRQAPAAIAPDMSPEDLLAALRFLYPPPKEALGVIAIEIEPEVRE